MSYFFRVECHALQNCEALFFENKLIGIFCSAAHCIILSHNKFGWIENWEFCNIYSSEHAIFLCCIKFFFSEVFLKHFEHALCHVLCTYQNRCWAISTGQKKTCDIIIHLVPRLTFRHIGDFHDTHMRSLPGNCN